MSRDTYRALHREAHAAFAVAMAQRGFPIDMGHISHGPDKVGYTAPSGETYRWQWNVIMEKGRTVAETMGVLADFAAAARIDRWGRLPCQRGLWYARNMGPLRMLVYVDISPTTPEIRFDVLGASSQRSAVDDIAVGQLVRASNP